MENLNKNSCTLVWQEPTDNGGSKIELYLVERREAGRQAWVKIATLEPNILKHDVDKLVEGRAYEFSVRAKNKYDLSEATCITATPKCPYNPPDAPDAPEIKDVFQNEMTIYWREPRYDGGSSVTGYYIEVSSCGGNWLRLNKQYLDPETFHYKASDLVKGKEYSFR